MSLYESMKPGAIGIKKYPDEEDLKPYFYQDHCDRYDYLAAAACGAMAGLVDIFLGSSPADSALSGWTDEQVDHAVMKFADYCGWSPRLGKEDSVASAIGFLEKKYPVNYDQAYATGSDAIFDMSTKNHHLKSLGHAPDIVGLFFSILNQFTETSTFISDGQLITIKSDPIEMQEETSFPNSSAAWRTGSAILCQTSQEAPAHRDEEAALPFPSMSSSASVISAPSRSGSTGTPLPKSRRKSFRKATTSASALPWRFPSSSATCPSASSGRSASIFTTISRSKTAFRITAIRASASCS